MQLWSYRDEDTRYVDLQGGGGGGWGDMEVSPAPQLPVLQKRRRHSGTQVPRGVLVKGRYAGSCLLSVFEGDFHSGL